MCQRWREPSEQHKVTRVVCLTDGAPLPGDLTEWIQEMKPGPTTPHYRWREQRGSHASEMRLYMMHTASDAFSSAITKQPGSPMERMKQEVVYNNREYI